MKTTSVGRLLFAAALVGCVGRIHDAGAAEAAHYIGRLGFTDPKHTRADGFQSSTVVGLSDVGYTAGTSRRFVAPPISEQSAWMGSPLGGTKAIGFYDAAHTSASGSHYSRVVKLTKSGRAIGLSARYDGTPQQTGRTAWLASWGGGTRRIGLFYDDPFPTNSVLDLNEAGQAIGVAPFANGQHAWIADVNGVTRIIGLQDAAHMSPGQAPFNTPVALNASGTVAGHAQWSGGQVVWVQPKNGGPAVPIGVYDADHTYSNGTVLNVAEAVNSHGYVVGRARNNFLGEEDTDPMYSMWLWKPNGETQIMIYNGSADTAVQLTDSNLVAGDERSSPSRMVWFFNGNTGEQFSLGLVFDTEVYAYANGLIGLTENGVVLGAAGYSRGSYAWLFNLASGQTWRLGFPYNLGAPGAVRSVLTAFAPNGTPVGYSGGGYNEGYGQVGWIASPTTGQSYAIGLKDPVHLNLPNDSGIAGYFAMPTHVTNSRFVAGYNLRYHGDYESEGQTAWIYNSPKGRYARLEFSVRAADGYAFSQVNQLLESGVAIGTYKKFAEDGTDLGDRAFVWVTGQGAFDIGERLNVDPETVDWDYLANAVLANEAGFIAGHGVPFDSTSQGVFLVRLSH